MNEAMLRQRAQNLKAEVGTKTADFEAGRIEPAQFKSFIDKAVEESGEIETTLKALEGGNRFMANQDAAFTHLHSGGSLDSYTPYGASTKAFQPSAAQNAYSANDGAKWRPGSPLDGSADVAAMWKAAFDAGRAGQGFRFEIQAKGTPGFAEQIRVKTNGSPVADGVGSGSMGGPPWNTQPTGIPPVMEPGLTLILPLEPDDVFSHLSGLALDVPAIEFMAHTGDTNTASPAVVAELGTMEDVGQTWAPTLITPTKIASQGSLSIEAMQDVKFLQSFVPSELSRLQVNKRSDYVINGGTEDGPSGFTGILAISGTLTRDVGSDTPLDAIQKSFNDLRTGTAFATADLVLMNPTSWNSVKRQKSTIGTYLLDPNPATGVVDSLWGTKVVVNTWVPAGTAIVLDTNKSLVAWQRSSLVIETNMYGDGWDNGYWQYRAWERIGLGVRWAAAINIVTGLPTS